jgi:hypothetical protein
MPSIGALCAPVSYLSSTHTSLLDEESGAIERSLLAGALLAFPDQGSSCRTSLRRCNCSCFVVSEWTVVGERALGHHQEY